MTAEFWVGPTSAPDTFGLVSMLGGGGEGEVWKGVVPLSTGGRRVVAVKIMRAHGDVDESERWERFGHLLRGLTHPGLVRVTDVFAGAGMHRAGAVGAGDYLYVVMDYIDGTSMQEWIAENPETTVSQRLRMLRMIASALDSMHAGATTEVPVAHGDVKPANIVVGEDQGAVLVDLGLARLTDDAGVSGHSAPYASPELRSPGALATPEADRYAFAVTTAQMLTGAPPPLGADGWLDVAELEEQLRQSPLTGRRHALIQRILATLAAPPDARPRELRVWLDGTVESLSQITGPAGPGVASDAAVPLAQDAADRSVLPTVVPGGPMPLRPGALLGTPPSPASPEGGRSADVAQVSGPPSVSRRGARYRVLLAVAAVLLMLGGGTVLTVWGTAGGPPGQTVAGSPKAGSATSNPSSQQNLLPTAAGGSSLAALTTPGSGTMPAGPSGGGSTQPVHGNPIVTTCAYTDAGNGRPITAAKGSTFTDSRGVKYRVGNDCTLTQISSAAPQTCSYSDAGNGQPITAAKGSTFTDSRGVKYRVGNDCTLTQIPSDTGKCSYSDAGNGQPISAAKGSTFTDSLGRTYRVGNDCVLTQV